MEREYLIGGLIVLAVIVVVSIMLLNFYPEMREQIGAVADEVFQIRKEVWEETAIEKAKANAETTFDELITSFRNCIEITKANCTCHLRTYILPEGHEIIFANTNDDLVIQLRYEQAIVISEKFSNKKLGIAVRAKKGGVQDLACLHTNNLLIKSDAYKRLFVYEHEETQGQYFFHDNINEIYKINENELCMITNAITEKSFELNKEYTKITTLPKPTGTWRILKETHYSRKAKEFFQNKNFCIKPITEKLAWPAEANILSCWGWRTLPTGGRDYHDGIDIGVPENTEVRAAADGVITSTCDKQTKNFEDSGYKKKCGGFGKYIVIKHSKNLYSRYSHLSEIKLGEGYRVRQGDVIGRSGNTGYSFGPHLDFKVYTSKKDVTKKDAGVNPTCYLQPTPTEKYVGASCIDEDGIGTCTTIAA